MFTSIDEFTDLFLIFCLADVGVGHKAQRNTALCFLLVITSRDEKSIQLHDLLVNHEFSFCCVFSVFSFVFIFTKLHLWKREQTVNKEGPAASHRAFFLFLTCHQF
jgi:hypothetical protein